MRIGQCVITFLLFSIAVAPRPKRVVVNSRHAGAASASSRHELPAASDDDYLGASCRSTFPASTFLEARVHFSPVVFLIAEPSRPPVPEPARERPVRAAATRAALGVAAALGESGEGSDLEVEGAPDSRWNEGPYVPAYLTSP